MTEKQEVEGRIIDVKPLVPLKVSLEIKEKEGMTSGESIFFLDQAENKIYDLQGPANDNLQEAIMQWIVKKSEEVKREMMSGLAKATPEQLKAMGIDIKDMEAVKPSSKIIMSK